MIIEKPGKNIDKPWISEIITCPKCTCEFRLEEKDRKKTIFSKMFEGLLPEFVRCPFCKYGFRVDFFDWG